MPPADRALERGVGETVTLAYADQDRSLDPDKTVWETISGGRDLIPLVARSASGVRFHPHLHVRSEG